MTRENKPETAAEKRVEYAYWSIPGATAAVTYSLPLFHEIDFAVNEGYRKIPHGGIEEGGLLFGKIDEKGTQVETFRPIACEHASGPSFLLSEQDLTQLKAQIEGAAADPELKNLEIVGWFLAHTRGPLALTDREVDLCDRFFAGPGMITVLVKPERFQPTRFGFLVRGQDGSLPRDGAQNAIILPLPGRNAKAANGPMASIPAPATNTITARRPTEPEIQDESPDPIEKPSVASPQEQDAKPAAKPAAAETPNRMTRRQRRLNIEQVRPTAEEVEDARLVEQNEQAAARAKEAGEVPEERPLRPGPAVRLRGGELEPLRRGSLTNSERAMAVRREPEEIDDIDSLPDPYRQMELLNQKRPVSAAARMVLVLPLAALLGCLVGWVAYLQVPSPIIPLTVKEQGSNLIVTWPADQTRNAVYAAVRLDDGTPEMLTAEEKSAGRVKVEAAAERKVELIARNWIHDSRGIVHYVKPVANTAP